MNLISYRLVTLNYSTNIGCNKLLGSEMVQSCVGRNISF